MCEVEAIVNSRPITTSSDDPSDCEALTPNSLLLLRSGPCLPPGSFSKEDAHSRRRWRQVQYLAEVYILSSLDPGVPAAVTSQTEVGESFEEFRGW